MPIVHGHWWTYRKEEGICKKQRRCMFTVMLVLYNFCVVLFKNIKCRCAGGYRWLYQEVKKIEKIEETYWFPMLQNLWKRQKKRSWF